MTIKPDRKLVERIICEEAEAANVPSWMLSMLSPDREARTARESAMRRIAKETGAGPTAIARVWGCSIPTVAKALGRTSIPTPPPGPSRGRLRRPHHRTPDLAPRPGADGGDCRWPGCSHERRPSGLAPSGS